MSAPAKKPAPMVVTITREEFRPPRGGYDNYAGNWRWIYRIANVPKPHRRLEHAIKEARRRWPGCRIRKAWLAGGA